MKRNFETHLDLILEHAALGTLCFDCPANKDKASGACPECGKNANRDDAKANCIAYYKAWAKKESK